MIKPTPGSGAPNAENQLPPNGSSDIIERTTAKKIKAPRSPHAVTVIHACRNHQRCSADPGLGFMAASARIAILTSEHPHSPALAACSMTARTAWSRISRSLRASVREGQDVSPTLRGLLTPSYSPLRAVGLDRASGPDACRSDPSAPCLYWHLKLHALNGGRDKLSQRNLEFVGVDTWPINTPGWRSPIGLYLDDPLDGLLSPEQIALLRSVMDIEFLG
jgi:hypothetical protein